MQPDFLLTVTRRFAFSITKLSPVSCAWVAMKTGAIWGPAERDRPCTPSPEHRERRSVLSSVRFACRMTTTPSLRFSRGCVFNVNACWVCIGQLHLDGHGSRAAPAEWIEDHDRNGIRSLYLRVNSFGDGLQRFRGDFIGGPADYVVVLLRVLIDDADAGAGGEVVELVEEHLLPVLGEFGGGVVVAVEPGERCPLLGVQHFL